MFKDRLLTYQAVCRPGVVCVSYQKKSTRTIESIVGHETIIYLPD